MDGWPDEMSVVTATMSQMNHLAATQRPYTVAVDIDGVLYELVPALRLWIHYRHGRPLHTMPDPGLYDLETAWSLPPGFLVQQLRDGVQAGFLFWQGHAHAPGLAGLRALREAGHRIVLVTARDLPGLEDLCFEATETWLTSPQVGAVYDELVLASNKCAVEWDFLIDDYEKNVRAAHAAGRQAILLNRGWNRDVALDQAAWEAIPALVGAAAKLRLAA